MSAEFDEMLASIDMEEWLAFESIEYRVTRGTRGQQLNVKCCPSCGKEVWKVYINADTGLGNCFSGDCPKGTFNKFSFMREYQLKYNEKVVMRDYVKSVAREMGWRPKRKTAALVDMTSDDLILPEYIPIPIKGKNLKYLTNRRVSIQVAEYFNLGYIPEGYFGKRVFIPIHDLDGSMVSFQARDITGIDPKKYLFPSGFASTGRILYNGQNAIGKLSAVLVEGAFDVIATKIALDEDKELRNVAVLGSFGMQLSGDTVSGSDDQLSRFLELKKSGLKVVTIMWDGETKAILKAIKAGEVLKRIGLKVKLAILPKDRDPADIDPETLRQCFTRAKWLTPQYAMQIKLMGDKIHLKNK